MKRSEIKSNQSTVLLSKSGYVSRTECNGQSSREPAFKVTVKVLSEDRQNLHFEDYILTMANSQSERILKGLFSNSGGKDRLFINFECRPSGITRVDDSGKATSAPVHRAELIRVSRAWINERTVYKAARTPQADFLMSA